MLYPFTILATWFHEMSHGLAAILLGGTFKSLSISMNGSGHASVAGPFFMGRLGDAFVAAAGPMGPAVAGALFILSSKRLRTARTALFLLGVALLFSTAYWVRDSLTGWVVLPLIAAGILAIAWKAEDWAQSFTIQFLGVQACISTFLQIDYLFTNKVQIGDELVPSDTGAIAEALWLPYWMWGILLTAASLALLVQSLRIVFPFREWTWPWNWFRRDASSPAEVETSTNPTALEEFEASTPSQPTAATPKPQPPSPDAPELPS